MSGNASLEDSLSTLPLWALELDEEVSLATSTTLSLLYFMSFFCYLELRFFIMECISLIFYSKLVISISACSFPSTLWNDFYLLSHALKIEGLSRFFFFAFFSLEEAAAL